tara:strand:- start:7264 stop:7680 length:417 start_codon:yes stop_codon:yes gene_type:complete
MAFAPLILTGNLEIDGVDVSAQVTAFKFSAARAQIEIPQTFGTRMSFAAGNDSYEIEIEYLSDNDATALSQIFWTAIADADGTVTCAGTFRTGAVSATNPQWTATAVVTGVGIGGEVNTVGVDSQTFPLTDRPTQAVA